MDHLSYEVSAPASFEMYGTETLSVWLPSLTGAVDLRTTVKFKEEGEKNFVLDLNLLEQKQEIVFKHMKLHERFLDERLPLSIGGESIFNIHTPQLIKMEEMDQKILQFLGEVSKKTYDPNILFAIKACLFLYSGILSPFYIRVKPMIIEVSTQIKPDYLMGHFESYCVAMAGTFVHYVKCKSMEQSNREILPKKIYKFPKSIPKDFCNFTEEDKHCVRMWAYCATYFLRCFASGASAYCSTYGGLILYTPKDENWDPEIEFIPGGNAKVLLVDTGVVPYTETRALKMAYKERYQGLYHAWCILTSKISIAAAKCLRTKKCRSPEHTHCGTIASTSNEESSTLAHEDTSSCDTYMPRFCYVVHNIIRALQLSHKKADEVLEIAYGFNLRGCLIGSSRGGMVYILLPSHIAEETKLKDAYKKANFKYTTSVLGTVGLTLNSESDASRRSLLFKK